MKVNKYISIDEDIFKNLIREENASNLINELLKAHYQQKTFENIIILKEKLVEIQKINKENRKKEKELMQKIIKLDEKNKEFFLNFKKSYPSDLIERLKKIENLDYEHALSLCRTYDLLDRGIGGIKLIKIWEEVNKNVLDK